MIESCGTVRWVPKGHITLEKAWLLYVVRAPHQYNNTEKEEIKTTTTVHWLLNIYVQIL